MKKIHKYLGLLIFFIALSITSIYTYLITSLIGRYIRSVLISIIISFSLFLIFGILAMAYKRRKYIDPALWAASIVFFVTSIGFVGQYIYNKAMSSLGLLLFTILGAIAIYLFVFFGIMKVNKAIKGTLT